MRGASDERADALFPDAVLLVDRRSVLDLFLAADLMVAERLAVVCIDGSPGAIVAWLQRGARAGRRAPVLYIHDAATVIYPFTLEPVASLMDAARAGAEALQFVDLGLPPLGAAARRFGDPALAPDALVVALEAIPPATLVRYCVEAMRALVPRDPSAPPLPAPPPAAARPATRGAGPRRARSR